MIDFKLYVITDRNRCTPKSLQTVVSEILDVGVNAIQLREKDLDDTSLYQVAKPISALCKTYEAHLFINTNLQVAIDVGAAGVHLPDDATSVKQVREQADIDILIGCSIHSIDSAQKREAEGADFITYSPIYQAYNKPGVGIVSLQKLVKHTHIPLFALGGVTPVRVYECLAAGASGIAVMSGIMGPVDADEKSKKYLSELKSNFEFISN